MQSTEQTLEVMRREMQRHMRPLLETAMEGVLSKARSVLEEAEQQRTQGLAEMAEEHVERLAEVARSEPKNSPKSTQGEPSCTARLQPCKCTKQHTKAASSSTSAATALRHRCRRCAASRTLFSTPTSVAGTRRTCPLTAVSS
jgi:hypothetical protein